ncbi:cytochrome c1 [Falsirhodobacter sp. alg1]|uniref:cytochrome c1 n=1 Tax=Falsirhodobacter sp. alg1 TaxID=1472418 RepID=UPI00178CCD71|nr:cytochrome c1 [Falsirhodobacter sp. alg1]
MKIALLVAMLMAPPAVAQGIFQTYDSDQLRRGLEVYTDTCSACHGLKHVPLRSLGDPDGPALDAAAIAAIGTPTDHFPPSALPEAPDLSVMARARSNPDHIRALLQGYTGEEREDHGAYLYGNTEFAGGWIAMPPTGLDAAQSEDVAAFLAWAADPNMAARKRSGFTAVAYLLVLAVLLALTTRSVWRRQPR